VVLMGGVVRSVVGQLVVHPKTPGIARIAEIADDRARLDLFESAAQPVVAVGATDRGSALSTGPPNARLLA
jgi:hypothetical protein